MLQNYTAWKVLELFFLEPTKEHYLLEISRKISLAHTSVKRILDELEKLSIITTKVIIRNTRKFPVFVANIDNEEYKRYKIIHAIDSLHELTDYLDNKLAPRAIVLFGSYLRAEDDEESDIDLYVQAKEETINLDKFEKKLGRIIQLHFKSNFFDYHEGLRKNIANGYVIKGYLDVYEDNKKGQRTSEDSKNSGRKNIRKITKNR